MVFKKPSNVQKVCPLIPMQGSECLPRLKSVVREMEGSVVAWTLIP